MLTNAMPMLALQRYRKSLETQYFLNELLKKTAVINMWEQGQIQVFFSKIRSAYERHVRPTWLNLPAGLTQPVGVAHAKGTEDTSAGSNTVLE